MVLGAKYMKRATGLIKKYNKRLKRPSSEEKLTHSLGLSSNGHRVEVRRIRPVEDSPARPGEGQAEDDRSRLAVVVVHNRLVVVAGCSRRRDIHPVGEAAGRIRRTVLAVVRCTGPPVVVLLQELAGFSHPWCRRRSQWHQATSSQAIFKNKKLAF